MSDSLFQVRGTVTSVPKDIRSRIEVLRGTTFVYH